MRAYSQIPMKILFIEFMFPKLYLGLLFLLVLLFSNPLYAHSKPVYQFPTATEITLRFIEPATPFDSLLVAENAFIHRKDSIPIYPNTLDANDSISHENQKTKIYITSGTTIINADGFQNASLVYLDPPTPKKETPRKEKAKKISKEKTKPEIASSIKVKPPKQLLHTNSKSKEFLSSHLGNGLAIIILSNAHKTLKPSTSFYIDFSNNREVSAIPYKDSIKDWKIHTKSRERAPPRSVFVFV